MCWSVAVVPSLSVAGLLASAFVAFEECIQYKALLLHRFFGLFGMYYSLQYLSLSDAVVLTFLIPACTALSGYFFLGEGYSRGQAFATGTSRFPFSGRLVTN